MGRNLHHYEWTVDKNGERVAHAVPFECCMCHDLSSYGADGSWYCTFCWQKLKTHSNGCSSEGQSTVLDEVEIITDIKL